MSRQPRGNRRLRDSHGSCIVVEATGGMGNGTRTGCSGSNQCIHLDGSACTEMGVNRSGHAKILPLNNVPFDKLFPVLIISIRGLLPQKRSPKFKFSPSRNPLQGRLPSKSRVFGVLALSRTFFANLVQRRSSWRWKWRISSE